MPLLEIRNLTVRFPTSRGVLTAVEGVDLTVEPGEVLGIVGESGSGKSVSMLAIMGLLGPGAELTADRLSFDGNDLRGLSAKARRRLVGKDIAMIFQDPMTSLNPCFTAGWQIMEALKIHEGGSRASRKARTIELLAQVGIPAPERRMHSFPHQLSGGMSQRVMIAMAIACNPRLLIADEPTTALDVTIQKQILDLLAALQKDRGMALVLITHDMGVIGDVAERVVVMYAGQVMEERRVARLFDAARHPYTASLLRARPDHAAPRSRLPSIPGVVPGIDDRPQGCLFTPRCFQARPDDCGRNRPVLAGPTEGRVRCHYPLDEAPLPAAMPRAS